MAGQPHIYCMTEEKKMAKTKEMCTLLRVVENKLKVNCSKFSFSDYVGVSADLSERGSGGEGICV